MLPSAAGLLPGASVLPGTASVVSSSACALPLGLHRLLDCSPAPCVLPRTASVASSSACALPLGLHGPYDWACWLTSRVVQGSLRASRQKRSPLVCCRRGLACCWQRPCTGTPQGPAAPLQGTTTRPPPLLGTPHSGRCEHHADGPASNTARLLSAGAYTSACFCLSACLSQARGCSTVCLGAAGVLQDSMQADDACWCAGWACGPGHVHSFRAAAAIPHSTLRAASAQLRLTRCFMCCLQHT